VPCPDDNALWALATDALSDDARGAAEAHLDLCPACRTALAALARLQAPGHAPAPRSRGATLGRYIIVDAVGAGGMGVVYRAFDPELDRKVALKLVRTAGVRDQARLRERLAREARLLARISHPNVVSVYDVGVVGDEVFLAMEFIAGPTLAAWQAQRERPWHAILDLYLQAARGLAQAHELGVIHRDFKASNALVGPDGRVRVVDFGLARTEDLAELAHDLSHGTSGPVPHDLSPGTSGPVPHDMSHGTSGPVPHDLSHGPVHALTSHGALLGTPAYMAPEQRQGRPADARSDQYSLCVALHEALLGVRPDAARATTAHPGEPTRSRADARKLPRWLRRALQRGLLPDPAKRWPDMHALISACERRRHSVPGRILLASLTTLTLALAAGLALHTPAPPPPQCHGAAAELASAWNPERRATIATRFSTTGPRYAAATWQTTAAALDHFATTWTDAHTRTCEATRIYGHQSEAELTRRMRCLDDRRAELQQTVDLLARAEHDLVERAVTIAYGLPDPNTCITRASDDEADRDDPAVRHVRDRIAEAATLVRAARYADARALLGDALTVATARGWHTQLADGALTLAEAEDQLGQPAAAEEALYRAIWAATAAHDDARDARAWTRMAPLIAEKLARPAEAHRALEHARAALARHNPDPLLIAETRASAAAVAIVDGNFAAARDTLAAALADSPLAADDPRQIKPISNYGVSFYMLGDHLAAAEQYRRALAIAEPRLGHEHPEVGNLVNNLGNALLALDDLDAAETQQRRALQIFRDSLGEAHPSTAGALANLANTAVLRGQPAQAVNRYREALAILTANGRHHPDEARVAYNLGATLIRMQQPQAALASFERAASAQRRDHPGHPDLGAHLTGVGIAHVEAGEPAAAIAPLEEAIAIFLAAPRDPLYLAQARFELARALWASRSDRPRALQLAQQARQTYREQPGGDRFHVEVDAWLAAHHI
jgi:serine/threonine protein kinase/tetratricopeptide (TPR) repeat protein